MFCEYFGYDNSCIFYVIVMYCFKYFMICIVFVVVLVIFVYFIWFVMKFVYNDVMIFLGIFWIIDYYFIEVLYFGVCVYFSCCCREFVFCFCYWVICYGVEGFIFLFFVFVY